MGAHTLLSGLIPSRFQSLCILITQEVITHTQAQSGPYPMLYFPPFSCELWSNPSLFVSCCFGFCECHSCSITKLLPFHLGTVWSSSQVLQGQEVAQCSPSTCQPLNPLSNFALFEAISIKLQHLLQWPFCCSVLAPGFLTHSTFMAGSWLRV